MILNEYEQKAIDFLKETNAKVELRYKDYNFHFPDDKEKRDVWEFRIVRGNRKYQADFGDSIQSHLDLINKYFGGAKTEQNARYYMAEISRAGIDYDIGLKNRKFINAINSQREWAEAGTGDRPSAYSILACLTNYEPEDLDSFALEFGYTKPSEAIRVWEAVKKEWQGIKELFTDEEIEKLRDIA